MTAIDVSADALALARENAGADRPRRSSCSSTTCRRPAGWPYDLVVSNPPYVEPADLETLMPDVREYEPHRRARRQRVHRGGRPRRTSTCFVPGGRLVLEVGDGQASATAALLDGLGYADVSTTPDLTGRDRVVEGRRV